MANATPSRLGMINGTGETDALFLKAFAGEVLTAFAEVDVIMGRHLVRTISNGKSASFPATWKVDATYLRSRCSRSTTFGCGTRETGQGGLLGMVNDENVVPYNGRHTCPSCMIQKGAPSPSSCAGWGIVDPDDHARRPPRPSDLKAAAEILEAAE